MTRSQRLCATTTGKAEFPLAQYTMCNTFSDIGDISKQYRSVKRVTKYFYFRIKREKRIKKDTYGFHLMSKRN